MKTTQRRICKGYLRVGYSKGVRLHPLHLAETQRQGRGVGRLSNGKRKMLQEKCFPGEAVGGLTREASCVNGSVSIFGFFLVGPKLEAGAKFREAASY